MSCHVVCRSWRWCRVIGKASTKRWGWNSHLFLTIATPETNMEPKELVVSTGVFSGSMLNVSFRGVHIGVWNQLIFRLENHPNLQNTLLLCHDFLRNLFRVTHLEFWGSILFCCQSSRSVLCSRLSLRKFNNLLRPLCRRSTLGLGISTDYHPCKSRQFIAEVTPKGSLVRESYLVTPGH